MKVDREKKKEEGLYIISVAARLAEVHPQTLRLYERRGLLCPARTPNNRRRYSDADIIRLRHIQELTRNEGLNLSGVRKVLDMEDEMEALREKVSGLEQKLDEMRDRMANRARDLKRQVALSKMPPAKLAVKGGRRTSR